MKTTSFRAAGLLVAASLLALSTRAEAAPGAFDLSSPSNGAWCSATCTFKWTAASSATVYQLYVDGALKKDSIAAASPPSYALLAAEALPDGWHTWSVIAQDSGGNATPSASTWSVRVDSIALHGVSR